MDLLERCLTDDQMPLDLRAVGALVLLFGITPTRVVNLTADQLIERDGEHYLVLDRHQLLIPPRIAHLLRQLPVRRARAALPAKTDHRRLLFPGRPGIRPVNPASITNRLLRHGIQVLARRNTALISLAAELPGVVLADLLGLHVATGVRWAKLASRDWEAYLADRRAEAEQATSE
jgi:hypothetical protein